MLPCLFEKDISRVFKALQSHSNFSASPQMWMRKKHVSRSIRKALLYSKALLCLLLHWAYRGSQELLPQAAPLKWLKVNKQETLVLSGDRRVTQGYNKFGKS